MKKYVLDTSVIITNPRIYDAYKNATFIVPIIVLEELDKIKHQSGEAARNARVAIKYLDTLTSSVQDINSGIALDNGSVLIIDGKSHKIPITEEKTNDLRIIACARYHAKTDPETTILSNDVNMRVRAKSLGIEAAPHQGMKADVNEIYSGIAYIDNDEILADLYEHANTIDPKKYNLDLVTNQYVVFDNSDNQGAIGKMNEKGKIELLDEKKQKYEGWAIRPLNVEQFCAIDALMNPKIPLVSLIGLAGSGKSLIALSCALDLVEKGVYSKLIVYKPMISVGSEVGFLAGSLSEKIDPWFGSIFDNFEYLVANKKRKTQPSFPQEKRKLSEIQQQVNHIPDFKKELEILKNTGMVSFEAMTFIRGRSINNAIILMDEFQNLNKEEAKTFLTRAGENSKIILTGDISQIDNNKLDAINNGLTHVVEAFKGNPVSAHITLKECERSILAEVASQIL
jgi:PhoH-like ATPase